VFGWAKHLQYAYFDGMSIPDWTLADVDQRAYENPLARITRNVPTEPDIDSDRGPQSDRHRSWESRGLKPQFFEWVPPAESVQWGAFQRLVRLLRARQNQLVVVLGPFNVAMVQESGRAPYEQWCQVVKQWLDSQDVPCLQPSTLDPDQYGDASHPLTDGYRELARQLWAAEPFRTFVAKTLE
jgi:hypothetical protein